MQRKVVTILFCDLTGSTALGESVDPERLRALLASYFERMKAIVEHHGGSVEKFIGDAVMAVFGVPVVHEDDALRAVRAAAEMRDALGELGLQGRIGVMTGEVVTGTEERLATGDAVNVAARLEQAAATGEILVGSTTAELVSSAAELEPVEPLQLKGKSEPVPAYRLLRVHEAPERRHDTRFVGRERELATIREACERAQSERRCELLTIVGDAGVGKTRLVAEALALVPARIVRGRCLPYGEGITHWPVVEVLRQVDVLPPDEAASTAIRALLGETTAPSTAEEIAWAFRKTLEHAAATGLLAVVFDDIQWGEETFLDLIDHVALLSSGAPILLVCLARPELAERRPAWPVAIRLELLDEDEVAALIPPDLSDDLRGRIRRAAGGNPLFVSEMVAMAAEAEGEVNVPPTLQALLAARLDQLDAAERSVLERGAVEGEVFHRGAVKALTPEEPQVTPRLASLVRKELIRPETAVVLGDDGFRFRHILIRDAAYDALPKSVRADLHERFATWLEERGADLVELDEILGYHLEQAYRYRAELGTVDDGVSSAARARLTAAGRRAVLRADYTAAAGLLERAIALLPDDTVDVALESELVQALFWAGRGDAALRRAGELAQRASAAGNRVGELCGRILEGFVRLSYEPKGATDSLEALLTRALPELEALEDDHALFVAYHGLAHLANWRGRMDEMRRALERAATHAQRAGLPQRFIDWRAAVRNWGPTPASELLAWIGELERRDAEEPMVRYCEAIALAMLGRFEEALAIHAAVRAQLADRGGGMALAGATANSSARLALMMGNAEAVEWAKDACRALDEHGEKGFLSTSAGNLARALYAVGRVDEAESWAERAAELGARDDVMTQMLSSQVRAKVLARRGRADEAERLALEAVQMGDRTDMIDLTGDAYADLAEVLVLAKKRTEASAALEQALDRHERKGNLVSAKRVQERLAELRAEAPA